MAEKRTKNPLINTPKGVFKYPKLTKPDHGTEKFPKPNGEYNVRLVLHLGSPEADALIKKLQPYHDAAAAAGQEKFDKLPIATRKKLKELTVNPLYSEVYDKETEEPTGEIEFKFKMVAGGVRKKDNSKWSQKPGLFDAKGKPLPGTVEIWGGTIGKISFRPEEYFVEGQAQAGLSLRLEAAQVIDLVSAGQRTASGYGFGEEEGFDADDLPLNDTSDDTDTSDTDAGAVNVDDGNF